MKLKLFCDKITFYKKDDFYYPKSPVILKGYEVRAITLKKHEKREGKVSVSVSLNRLFGDHKVSEICEKIEILGKAFPVKNFRLKYISLKNAQISQSCYYKKEFENSIEVCFYFYRF